MTIGAKRVVLLLHEQLQDARLWSGLAELVGTHAEVVTAPARPPDRFYARPSEWAEYARSEAQTVLAAAGASAALTVAPGSAVGAAVALVENGLSERALLINPAPTPELLHEWRPPDPDAVGPELQEAFAALRPEPSAGPPGPQEAQTSHRILGPEAVEPLIEAAMSGLTALGEEQRRLVRQIQTEQYARLLPLSLDDIGPVDFSNEPSWVRAVAHRPQRYAVALSRLQSLPYTSLRDLLNRQVPELPVTQLPLVTPFPWLEDPHQVDQVVRDVLGRETDQ